MVERDRCGFCNTVYIIRTGDEYGKCPRCQRDTLRVALGKVLNLADVEPGTMMPVGEFWRIAHDALSDPGGT